MGDNSNIWPSTSTLALEQSFIFTSFFRRLISPWTHSITKRWLTLQKEKKTHVRSGIREWAEKSTNLYHQIFSEDPPYAASLIMLSLHIIHSGEKKLKYMAKVLHTKLEQCSQMLSVSYFCKHVQSHCTNLLFLTVGFSVAAGERLWN